MVQMRGAEEATTETYATRCTPAASLGSALGNIGFPKADEPLSRIGLERLANRLRGLGPSHEPDQRDDRQEVREHLDELGWYSASMALQGNL